jgi:hypothetical protein
MSHPLPTDSSFWAVDPVFTYQRSGRLDAHYGADPVAAWRHLSCLVARDPFDLEAQTRRVLLSTQVPHRAQAFGALIDLFLALGDKGRGLRQTLLDSARSCLAEDELRYLQAHLDTGLSRRATLPTGTGSVLDAAVIGNLHPVGQQRRAAQASSKVDDAIALLDQGDLPAAQALLEEALMENLDDTVALSELQAIYHHSRDEAAKASLQARLQERHGRLPAQWS